MTKEDFIRKITSRKFWLAVAAFVVLIMVYFGAEEDTATQVAAIIMAGATVLGYLLAEGLTDANEETIEVIDDTGDTDTDAADAADAALDAHTILDTAYELATANGFEGTQEEWLESLSNTGEG